MADLKDEALRWLGEAEYDLRTAHDNLAAARYNWACFIAQQAAEKAVKSLHIWQGETPERVHSISGLIRGSPERGVSPLPELAEQLEAAMELDRHYIPTRYPYGVPFGMPYEFYNEGKATECLELSERIIAACRRMFESM